MSEDAHQSDNCGDSILGDHGDTRTRYVVMRTFSNPASNEKFNNPYACIECDAPYGHYIECPCTNREVAEARMEADAIRARGLGVDITKPDRRS
jgi:hypothetical protein